MLKLWNFELVNSHQAEMKSLHHRPAAEYQSGTSQCSREEVFLNLNVFSEEVMSILACNRFTRVERSRAEE